MSFLKLKINPNRIYGLDILRALAILFVVLNHGKSFYPEATRSTATLLAFDGVAIFFVLSGFLIGSILIKNLKDNSGGSLFQFWTRRWMRTLPNYFLIFFIVLALSILFKENFNPWNKTSYLIFCQNLFSHKHFFFTESWSLSVEEWFYILVPLALYSSVRIFKLPLKPVLFFMAAVIIISVTAFRWNRFYEIPITNMGEWDNNFRRQVSTQLDSLMFGVIGAAIHSYFQSFWIKYKNLFFVFGLILLVTAQIIHTYNLNEFGFYTCVFSFTVNSTGVLFILPFLSSVKKGSGKLFSIFTYISLISYSMYLINFTLVKLWIVEKIPWDSMDENGLLVAILQPLLFWFLTIFLSMILYKYFELPIMNLRDSQKSKELENETIGASEISRN